MRWQRGYESRDVIDKRGQGGGGASLGGLIGILPFLLRSRYGWIGIVIILLVAVGGTFTDFFGFGGQRAADGKHRTGPPEQAEMVQFVSFVLDDSQKTWTELFSQKGDAYRNAKLVLFTGATQTSCGYGQAASGPFYCPRDQRVYIDLSFYRELATRFGAQGDFAQAYVIAHEIGHHVQTLRGISERVHKAPSSEQDGAGGLSVRLELQADCFAGVWAHSSQRRGLLETGDIDEALGAASAIGDDRIQSQSGGAVHPETWTHGSAAQRARWFKQGFQSGNPDACDTFSSTAL
ncbi:MAG: neutral zinc metallopeptidase [Polyangiaceae bacterium]|nr:zinc metallopeptidase [Polyangiaceae bacterium]NUQ79391.1 neutral zinc metallopeptidase [Polyangiaceae bacterium]